MLFDDEDEEYVSALFQVGDQVRQTLRAQLAGARVSARVGAATDASLTLQLFQQVLQLKQKPHEGREYDKEKEDRQEHVSDLRVHTQVPCKAGVRRMQAWHGTPGW